MLLTGNRPQAFAWALSIPPGPSRVLTIRGYFKQFIPARGGKAIVFGVYDPQKRWAGAASDLFTPSPGGQIELALRMTVGGRIRGRVVDADGMPVGGIALTASGPDEAATYVTSRATTEFDGRFELGPMRSREYVVRVVAPRGNVLQLDQLGQKLAVQEGQITEAGDLRFVGPKPPLPPAEPATRPATGAAQNRVFTIQTASGNTTVTIPDGGTLLIGGRPVTAPALPLRGVAMQLHRAAGADKDYKASIDQIAAVGADTVLFVVDSHMENGSASAIDLDRRLVPNAQQLGDIIDYARSKKLRVALMPIVLLDRPRGTEWRGVIKPENWSDWWNSYRAMLHDFASVAQSHHADVLAVGSELVSTERQADEWRTTIAQARRDFSGMLTYSANWDHYKDIPFWDQLDLVGMNSYWKLGEDQNVSVEQIQQSWAGIKKDVLSFQAKVAKPLVFLELGWCSLPNAASEPWDYTKAELPIDLELQRKLYEGFFRSWHGTPQLGGFMIWEWTTGDGGPNDRGYTPHSKPAENVLRDWLAKPWVAL